MAIENMSKEDQQMNEQIMKALDQISVQCPVHKLNLNDDNKNSIAGSYLMTFGNVEEILKPVAQMDDLTNDTVLFFDNRHIMEMLQLFYGMARVLVDARFISADTRRDFLVDILDTINSNRAVTYYRFKSLMDQVYSDYFAAKGIKEVSMRNIRNILQMIWFVPYSKIDAIADQIIEEYRKRHPEEFQNAQQQTGEKT